MGGRTGRGGTSHVPFVSKCLRLSLPGFLQVPVQTWAYVGLWCSTLLFWGGRVY